MGDTATGAPVDRAALARVRDQLRTQLNERLGTQLADAESRYEEAYTRFLESDNGADTARLRLARARESVAEAADEAQRSEARAATLPATSPEREELLERAAKMRVVATAREPMVEQVRDNLERLEAEALERKAIADAVQAEHDQMIERVNAAENELDRLDDKIRLHERAEDMLAVAREVEADAYNLELEGDLEGAAQRRQEAAWHRTQADAAAAGADAIQVDTAPLTAAGLTVTAPMVSVVDQAAGEVVVTDEPAGDPGAESGPITSPSQVPDPGPENELSASVDDDELGGYDGDGLAEDEGLADEWSTTDGDHDDLDLAAAVGLTPPMAAPDRVGFADYDDSFAVDDAEVDLVASMDDAPVDDI